MGVVRPLRWAYGVTTCRVIPYGNGSTTRLVQPERLLLLPRTLEYLSKGGFNYPRLFVDGDDGFDWSVYGFTPAMVTRRTPAIRAYGNWILALAELFIRSPLADRYAIFQDDLECGVNLRQYLESLPYKDNTYLNLYSFPSNEELASQRLGSRVGFYEGWQQGKGALGLVFNRDAVVTLLHHQHMIMKPMAAKKPWSSIDGAVSEAMKAAGYKELVHYPSLLQHTGSISAMRNTPHPKSTSFKGVDFDYMSLLPNHILVQS